jgi:hypothetical protein
MKKLLFWSLQTFLFCGMLLACVGSLQLTVLYDRTEGLKQNDPVLWNEGEISGRKSQMKADSSFKPIPRTVGVALSRWSTLQRREIPFQPELQ